MLNLGHVMRQVRWMTHDTQCGLASSVPSLFLYACRDHYTSENSPNTHLKKDALNCMCFEAQSSFWLMLRRKLERGIRSCVQANLRRSRDFFLHSWDQGRNPFHKKGGPSGCQVKMKICALHPELEFPFTKLSMCV